MDLKHNILKTYWKLKLPFSDEEIQQGVHDVDMWLCSPGGAGSNMLKNYLHQFIRVKSPYMAGLLTHHSKPVPCKKENFKAIFLHRHPLDALQSMKRRGLIKKNIQKLNNSRNLPSTEKELLKSIFRQFTHWTTLSVNYPILCVKYERLFENKNQIADFLGIEMKNFPEAKIKSNEQVHDLDIGKYFLGEIADWEAFPEVVLIKPNSEWRCKSQLM